jgi:hypothetical protein
MRTIIDCIKANPLDLFEGADLSDGKNYAYFAGKGEILLQAHVDTIFPAKKLKEFKNFITGKGLGADDRAGVFACLELKQRFPNMPILLTNFEESGGKGMETMVLSLSDEVFKNVNLAIAIDRMGVGNYVTYNDLPKKCKNYVESFGWHEEIGSFSDIQIFTGFYEIPSVNIACGYYNQHTKKEFLVLDELQFTIDRLSEMLEEPINKRYKPKKTVRNNYWDYRYWRDDFSSENYFGKGQCPFCSSLDIQDYADFVYCNQCGETWHASEIEFIESIN